MERMMTPDRALELVLENVPAKRTVRRELQHALGHVLAERIEAPHDTPGFVRAMMDGLAVCVADAGREIRVADLVAAGHPGQATVAPGRGVEIMTGAPCPEGTEAVVMVEHIERFEDRVRLPDKIKPGQHVQRVGDLCRRGAVTLEPGAPITPLVIGHLAAFDRADVLLYEPPSVAVISTGDELVAVGQPLAEGQIRDSNGPMLVALARELGVTRTRLLHASDTEESLAKAIAEARESDLVVLTGGVSMGRFDLVPRALEVEGARAVFYKASQKPGKPLLFATAGQRLFFGLPGNARSTHFCFTRYVASAIRSWMGKSPALRQDTGTLAASYDCKSDRTLFVPMLARKQDPGWLLSPLDDRGSADIYNIAIANAYVRFEAGKCVFDAGAPLPFFWMGDHG